MELQTERAAGVTGSPAVNHAGDRRLRIEPASSERRPKRHDHLFAGEHAIMGRDHHAFGRQIERQIRNALEIVLAHDLTRNEDAPTKRLPMLFARENDAHRNLL